MSKFYYLNGKTIHDAKKYQTKTQNICSMYDRQVINIHNTKRAISNH